MSSPIVPNFGIVDEHIGVLEDQLYNCTCHDYSPISKEWKGIKNI